jgi:hypothetical protein
LLATLALGDQVMAIPVSCPHCGATGNAPDNFAGQQVKCSKCKKPFLVSSTGVKGPPPATPPPPAPPAQADEVEEAEDIEDADDLEEDKKMARRRRDDDDDYDDDFDDDEDDRPRSVRKKPKKRRDGGGGFPEFLMLRSFIGPVLIVIFFWLGFFALVFGGGFVSLMMLINLPGSAKLLGLLYGFLTVIIGPLWWRIMCELMMVMYRQLETLTDIKSDLEQKD